MIADGCVGGEVFIFSSASALPERETTTITKTTKTRRTTTP